MTKQVSRIAFINTLPQTVQEQIKATLVTEAGLEGQDLEDAMNSRLTDLEDTIDIQSVLNNLQ